MSEKPKVLGIIPARLGSTRVPEKMLADICGKPLIAWTIERTKKAHSLDALVVATDSERIAAAVAPLGVPVIMTSPELPTGTDRSAAAAKLFSDFTPDIVVTIWGDEPLYTHEAIDAVVALLAGDQGLEVAGVADRITEAALHAEPSLVKVLTALDGTVLSFSRAAVPHPYRSQEAEPYHITGTQAMRRDFLFKYLELPQGPLEKTEGVEQMRILEHGYRMKVVKGDYGNLGVNTPEELERVRAILAARLSNPTERG